MAISLQRALIGDPVLVSEPHRNDAGLKDLGHASASIAILLGVVCSVVLAALGFLLPGAIGKGLRIFAPWATFAVVQDYWRCWLFRSGRGQAAAANDGIWLMVMVIGAPILYWRSSDWIVLSWWASGAVVSAIAGLWQAKYRVVPLHTSWKWWRRNAWPLGRWLMVERLLFFSNGSLLPFLIVGYLGAAPAGGLRAVQSAFAPVTLLGPTIALPGQPAVREALDRDLQQARRLAVHLSMRVFAAVCIYAAVIIPFAASLIRLLYGASFSIYRSLMWPIAFSQLLLGLQVGLVLLLKAARRGRELMIVQGVTGATTITAAMVLMAPMGIAGAAWAIFIGVSVQTCMYVLVAWMPRLRLRGMFLVRLRPFRVGGRLVETEDSECQPREQ